MKLLRELRMLEAIAKVEADGKPDSPLALALLEVKARRETGHPETRIWLTDTDGVYVVGSSTTESLAPAHGEMSNSDMPEIAPITKFKMDVDKIKKA